MARTLRSDVEALGARARETARDAEQICADTVASQPYAVAAAALGVGFVLGGGISRGAVTLLLGTGLRAASGALGRRVLEEAARYAEAHATAFGSADDAESPAPPPRSASTPEGERNPR